MARRADEWGQLRRPKPLTPAEGADLDMVVRPLRRGRKGILRIVIHRSSALRALTCAYLTRTPQPGSFS